MLTDADIHWYYDTEFKISREGYEPSPKELEQLRKIKSLLQKVRNSKRYNIAIELEKLRMMKRILERFSASIER